MSRFANLKRYLRLPEAIKIYLRLKTKKLNNIHISRLRHPFSLRKRNRFDYGTFEEVIVKETYNIPLDFNPRYIVDGGGNIGLTAAYFATKFPNASIVSLEPDKENFHLLKQNTSLYENVRSFNAGIWNKSAYLLIKDVGVGNNAFMVEESEKYVPGVVKALSLSDIMQEMSWPYFDVLKLDVEGSEKEIFSDGYELWLPKTRVLVIELHDHMKEGCSKTVFSTISQYNFSFEIAGQNIVFANKNNIF